MAPKPKVAGTARMLKGGRETHPQPSSAPLLVDSMALGGWNWQKTSGSKLEDETVPRGYQLMADPNLLQICKWGAEGGLLPTKLVSWDFMSLMESLSNQNFFRFITCSNGRKVVAISAVPKKPCVWKTNISAAFYWLILSMNLNNDVLLFWRLTTPPFGKSFIYLLQLYDETIPPMKPTKTSQ